MSAAGVREPEDQADRLVIREALDLNVVVEAAAGTGKTTELVRRILNVLARGLATVDHIVAVTFTEKAAGELKLRLRQELESARQTHAEAHVRERLTRAIQGLEEAHVSTIHGFCADLLKERPVEAGADPLFEVLTESRADALFADAFHGWLLEQLDAPPEGVRRALRRSVWSRDGRDRADAPTERLRRAARDLAEWRDFHGSWRRDPFDREAEVARLLTRIEDVAALTASVKRKQDRLYLDTLVLRELSDDVRTAGGDGSEVDRWEARLVDLARDRTLTRARRGSDKTYGATVDRDTVWSALQALIAELAEFQRAADADLAALLRDELRGVLARYESLKQRAGVLDFVDLLLRARDLLVAHPQVRTAFQSRFTHLFVDEFQDTDPLQAEILLLLAADDPAERDWRRVVPIPGKLFIVGDPKQAIYRFRRADIEAYQEVCELLEARGAKRAFLSTSFRSTPGIQKVINHAFAPLMTGDRETLQASYVALSPSRSDAAEQPSVVVLPVPEPYGLQRIAAYAIEKSFPSAVGAFVSWLVNESGWTVSERTAPDVLPISVPIEPRHICILFRRFLHFDEDVTRPYVEALEARGVPHLLVGGKSFHDREEVETMRAALAAVEWPDDELSVFATLRGALFAIDDEALLLYWHRYGRLHPLRVPQGVTDAEAQPIVEALALLKELHRKRNQRPIADTVSDLLAATRAHAGLVLRSGGEQALANVLHIAELARQHEADGGMSFRGFVEDLRQQAEDGRVAEAPILEEGSDGVRLMTTHKAKGLEFPVVILADMTAKLRSEKADRLVDRARETCYLRLAGWTPVELAEREAAEVARDEAEGVRLAYVAATRARDLLVIPGVGDDEFSGGWTSPLNGAIYPPVSGRREAAQAPGCPPFKKDSVWRRPENDPAGPHTVSPGQHAFGSGEDGYGVVWWDPFQLHLEVDAAPGLRREWLIARDVPESVVEEGLADYRRWELRREQAIAAGGVPSLAVRAATEWAASDSALPPVAPRPVPRAAPSQPGLFDDIEESLPSSPGVPPDSAGRVDVVDLRIEAGPGGARFGELVHAVLAAVPLEAAPSVVAAVAHLQARILSSPDIEVDAAVAAVRRVLSHALLTEAREAQARGRCRRETPVTYALDDGTLIEGVVDLAFETEHGWTVIDYKTDRELGAAGRERYVRQVTLYARAIAEAMGVTCRAALVLV